MIVKALCNEVTFSLQSENQSCHSRRLQMEFPFNFQLYIFSLQILSDSFEPQAWKVSVVW